jgi:hypothetical protein
MIKVTRAYKTNHFSLKGNISEEVLALADGRAVYLTPGLENEIFASLEEALDFCYGEPEESVSLTNAWGEGYKAI